MENLNEFLYDAKEKEDEQKRNLDWKLKIKRKTRKKIKTQSYKLSALDLNCLLKQQKQLKKRENLKKNKDEKV